MPTQLLGAYVIVGYLEKMINQKVKILMKREREKYIYINLKRK